MFGVAILHGVIENEGDPILAYHWPGPTEGESGKEVAKWDVKGAAEALPGVLHSCDSFTEENLGGKGADIVRFSKMREQPEGARLSFGVCTGQGGVEEGRITAHFNWLRRRAFLMVVLCHAAFNLPESLHRRISLDLRRLMELLWGDVEEVVGDPGHHWELNELFASYHNALFPPDPQAPHLRLTTPPSLLSASLDASPRGLLLPPPLRLALDESLLQFESAAPFFSSATEKGEAYSAYGVSMGSQGGWVCVGCGLMWRGLMLANRLPDEWSRSLLAYLRYASLDLQTSGSGTSCHKRDVYLPVREDAAVGFYPEAGVEASGAVERREGKLVCLTHGELLLCALLLPSPAHFGKPLQDWVATGTGVLNRTATSRLPQLKELFHAGVPKMLTSSSSSTAATDGLLNEGPHTVVMQYLMLSDVDGVVIAPTHDLWNSMEGIGPAYRAVHRGSRKGQDHALVMAHVDATFAQHVGHIREALHDLAEDEPLIESEGKLGGGAVHEYGMRLVERDGSGDLVISYWIVGCLFANGQEFYVCHEGSLPQTVVQLACRVFLG